MDLREKPPIMSLRDLKKDSAPCDVSGKAPGCPERKRRGGASHPTASWRVASKASIYPAIDTRAVFSWALPAMHTECETLAPWTATTKLCALLVTDHSGDWRHFYRHHLPQATQCLNETQKGGVSLCPKHCWRVVDPLPVACATNAISLRMS